MSFGETLRYLLDCKELTQKQMASDLHLAAPTVSNYAQGTREPDYSTHMRIASYFDVSVDYLLGYTPSPTAAVAEQELLAIYRSFNHDQKHLLLQQAQLLQQYNVKQSR